MRSILACTLLGVGMAGAGIAAQQTPTLGRASLTLGVPTRTHFDDCTHEDAEAKTNGWNLAFGLGVYRTCQSHVVGPARVGPLVAPKYTADALRAKIQGTVVLAAVIDTDGSVRDVRVLRSLDPGLDANAIDAVKRSTFSPGRRGANAVPVVVILEQQFTIR